MKTHTFFESIDSLFPFRFITGITATSTVGFAGSRVLTLDPGYCRSILSRLSLTDCRFAVGCAAGVDTSFHTILSEAFPDISDYYWLCAKRLESGTFVVPFTDSDENLKYTLKINLTELRLLIEGFDLKKIKKKERFSQKEFT